MSAIEPPRDDFRPTASWSNLRLRAQLLRRLRDFFHVRDFLEVETPLLSADTVVDRFIEPIAVDVGRPMWLQTSPEFCMKRLLAAGGDALYQITKAFRRGEQGRLHNTEFTIVEWYRVGDTMRDGMQLLDELGQEMLGRGPATRLSYHDAFLQHAGVDPHTADVCTLRDAVVKHLTGQIKSVESFDKDGLLNLLLSASVEPHLGHDRPAILYDYPASQAALAQVREANPPVAERFELYVDGIELANGYHELLDPEILRQRISEANEIRAREGMHRLPEESRLLSAMHNGLPACTGVALGFDRLAMIAASARHIHDVTAFPFDRA